MNLLVNIEEEYQLSYLLWVLLKRLGNKNPPSMRASLFIFSRFFLDFILEIDRMYKLQASSVTENKNYG